MLQTNKNYQGRSKGFGYVELESDEAALDALDKDRQQVKNRPMFVSRCEPDKMTRPKQFHFSQGMEKNKLFVKGLPFSTTKENLEQLFGQYGTLKDVRLVTYRYVFFLDKSSFVMQPWDLKLFWLAFHERIHNYIYLEVLHNKISLLIYLWFYPIF